MINLTNMTKKYFDTFGKSPKFEGSEPMNEEKTADCIGYCINNKVTSEELNEASKSQNKSNVWDFIMGEDLDEAGACKYGDREVR